MRIILYIVIKAWIWFSLRLFFHEVKVTGKGNIPSNKPVILIANHCNTLLDPLLMVTALRKKVWFLTRSDVFRKTLIARVLNFLGAMPVYRVSDGFKEPLKNAVTFSRCRTILNNKGILALFPEGTHYQHRTLRPLKQGIMRIWQENPEAVVVPVGLNFSHLSSSKAKVGVYFGEAIAYDPAITKQQLHTALEQQMRVAENYPETDSLLNLSWNQHHINTIIEPGKTPAAPWLAVRDILGKFPTLTKPFGFWSYVSNMLLAAACLPLVLVAAPSEIAFLLVNRIVLRGIKDPQFHLAIAWVNKHVWVTALAWICFAFWWNAGLFSAWGMLLLLMLLGHMVLPLFKRNVASLMAQIRYISLANPQQQAFKSWFETVVNQ